MTRVNSPGPLDGAATGACGREGGTPSGVGANCCGGANGCGAGAAANGAGAAGVAAAGGFCALKLCSICVKLPAVGAEPEEGDADGANGAGADADGGGGGAGSESVFKSCVKPPAAAGAEDAG